MATVAGRLPCLALRCSPSCLHAKQRTSCGETCQPQARGCRDCRNHAPSTENLGIERVIKNVLANPQIRFLMLCGEDTQQAVGHLPGQSLECLFRGGVDDRGRINGARGRRPVLKNVSREEVRAFLNQVELVSLIGEQDEEILIERIDAVSEHNPGTYAQAFVGTPIKRIQATESTQLTLDTAGYFVIYPERRTKKLVVEHYTNQGVLDCMMEGNSTGTLYTEAIERNLVTRPDHAAYLGRELARAEQSLLQGTPFVQDEAPGALPPISPRVLRRRAAPAAAPPLQRGTAE